MTIADLDAAIRAVCPIDGLARNKDGSIRIDFQATATTQQQQQAQTIAASANVNGNPSRSALDALAIFNYLKPSAGNLTAAQQNQIALACAAVVLAQNPALAARINTALGLSIPYDQANPQG